MAKTVNGETFGQYLRRARKYRQFGLRELARDVSRADGCRCSASYLSRIERDIFPPPSDRIVRALADLLILDPTDLLHRAGSKEATIARLRAENEELRAWKASALAIERTWDEQEVGRLLGLPLGASIKSAIEPGLRRVLAMQEELRATVERLPQTADGVRVYTHNVVYKVMRDPKWVDVGYEILACDIVFADGGEGLIAQGSGCISGSRPGEITYVWFDIEDCYSTSEAALLAREREAVGS